MKFTKMHGAGNDFVIINNMDMAIPPEEYSALAKVLCTRRLSVGADGMMIVVPAEHGGDYGMRFYNSDGTLGEMCGNGARCIARYGHDNGLTGNVQRIETTAGLVIGERIDDIRYRVRLNDPANIRTDLCIEAGGRMYRCTYLELGCPGIPHCLVRLDGWDKLPVDELRGLGKTLRCAPEFPKGANVTFRSPLPDGHWKCITFERGVEDFTLACGTGAGSTACAMLLNNELFSFTVALEFPGGTVEIDLKTNDGQICDIFLTGPTMVVSEGMYIGK